MSQGFVFQPMYTYLGNKRKLLEGIEDVVKQVKTRVGKERLSILDGFTGSTVVARMLTRHASEIHTNDLEFHSYAAAKCFLEQPDEKQKAQLKFHIDDMNSIIEFTPGIVTEMYAPQDTQDIKVGERCYFTHENALRIDTWRKYIDEYVAPEYKFWCLCPILIQMSIHANTMGHFKSFIKDKNNIGAFSAGKRVTDPLVLEMPMWHDQPCQVHCHNMDTNALLKDMHENGQKLDLIYYDPPYNQHEYAAFYFLLNVVGNNERPTDVNEVTGLPKKRVKSDYNYKAKAIKAMEELIANSTRVAEYTLISYNDEGLIGADDWNSLLQNYTFERFERQYQRYTGRGTETGKGRGEVVEIMYLIKAQ